MKIREKLGRKLGWAIKLYHNHNPIHREFDIWIISQRQHVIGQGVRHRHHEAARHETFPNRTIDILGSVLEEK